MHDFRNADAIFNHPQFALAIPLLNQVVPADALIDGLATFDALLVGSVVGVILLALLNHFGSPVLGGWLLRLWQFVRLAGSHVLGELLFELCRLVALLYPETGKGLSADFSTFDLYKRFKNLGFPEILIRV